MEKKTQRKMKVFNILNLKEDFFCEEELATVLKGLKIIKFQMLMNIYNKAPGADNVVNEFLKHGGSKVRNKLLKIMNTIFEKLLGLSKTFSPQFYRV